MVLTLVIPARTPASAPISVTGSLTVAQARGGTITIPPGCKGLVYVRLHSRYRPIYPSSGFINGDGREVQFGGEVALDGPPFWITLEGYNLDRTYPHTITAEIPE